MLRYKTEIAKNVKLPVTWWRDLLRGLEIRREIRIQVWLFSEKSDTRGYKYK